MYVNNMSEKREKIVSKHIFSGMFLFRGELTEALLREWENPDLVVKSIKTFFKTESLNKLYDKQGFDQYFNGFEKYSTKNKKHLLVLAFFGYYSLKGNEYKASLLDRVVSTITKKSNNSYYKTMYDLWGKIQYFTDKLFDFEAYVSTVKKNMEYKTIVVINDDKKIISYSSNFKSSRKKAFNDAIKYLLELEQQILFENEEYIELLRKKELEKLEKEKQRKEDRKKKHLEYIAEREENRIKRKNIFRKKQEIKKKLRKKAKARKQKRMKRLKEEQLKFYLELRNINSKKRRILEDRGILPKRK